jgi:hypothetical protein
VTKLDSAKRPMDRMESKSCVSDTEKAPACGRLFDIDGFLTDPEPNQFDGPRLIDDIVRRLPIKPAE